MALVTAELDQMTTFELDLETAVAFAQDARGRLPLGHAVRVARTSLACASFARALNIAGSNAATAVACVAISRPSASATRAASACASTIALSRCVRVAATIASSAWRPAIARSPWSSSYSSDGLHSICMFESADAERLREANRVAGAAFE